MAKVDEQDGKRYRITKDGEKLYLVIGEKFIMFFPPNEALTKHQELYASINANCRLASKFIALGGDWRTVVKQMMSANITQNRTLIREIAQIIVDDKGLS